MHHDFASALAVSSFSFDFSGVQREIENALEVAQRLNSGLDNRAD